MAMKNYTLGRGELHFSSFKPGTKTPAGFRYLGNSPEFSLTIDTETLDHFNSDRGIREKDDSVPLETTRSGSMTLDDIQPDNLAFFFFGSKDVLTQTSATGQTETFTDVIPGTHVQIGITNGNPTGVRDISNVVVKVGTTTQTVEEDYTVDLVLGMVTVVEGGGINEGDDIIVTYDRAAGSRNQIISGTQPVEGALRFISYNAKGDRYDYYMPSVKLTPNGDFGLKSDEWQTIPLNIDIQAAPNREAIYVDGRPFTGA